MAQINPRYDNKNGIMVDDGGDSRSVIRLAFTREYTKILSRSAFKMKIFISLITICCFSFSAFAGASIHTMIEMERDKVIMVHLINMPLRELAEYRI